MFKQQSNIPYPDDAKDIYDKLRVYKNGKVIKKIPFKDISTCSYTWDMTPIDALDDLDKEFEKNTENFEKIYVYGHHTYGGYYGFFRPDLMEIITYVQDIVRDAEVAYVTTGPCDIDGTPADNFYKCFNHDLDMHRGRTTVYYKKKAKFVKMTLIEKKNDDDVPVEKKLKK